MEFTHSQRERIQAWMNRYQWECSFCHSKSLVVGDNAWGLSRWNLGDGPPRADHDWGLVVVAVVCGSCGHVELFDVAKVGIA